jgi:hypothetical protein
MGLRITGAELFGVTETSATLAFTVEDDAGPVDAPARVRIGGERRAHCEGAGTRLVRIEGLEPQTAYRLGRCPRPAPSRSPPSPR